MKRSGPTGRTEEDREPDQVRLSDLCLAGPLSAAEVRHRSGDPVVGGLRLVRGWADLDAVGSDDLVVLDLAPGEGGWLIDACVRVVWQRWAAALVIPEHACLFDSPIRLARRHRVAVLSCEVEDVVALAIEVGHQVRAPRAESSARIVAAIDAITRADLDPEALVRAATAGLGRCTVTVVNRTGDVVAGPELSWLGPDLVRTHRDRDAPVPLDRPGAWMWPAQRVPRALELDVVVCWSDPSAAEARLPSNAPVVAALAARLAQWSLTRALEVEALAREQTELLASAMDRDAADDSHLRRRLGRHGWRLDGEHVGFHIRWRPGQETGAPDAAILRHRLRSRLATADYHGPLVEWAGGWVGWETATEIDRSVRTALRSSLETVVEESRPDDDLVAGIGAPGPGWQGWRESLLRARESALTATGSGGSRVRTSDRSIVDQLVTAPLAVPGVTRRAAALLAPLAEHDPELFTTLRAWLDAGSTSAAAAALGVHRNTVSSRLRRLAELLQVDFGDPDVRLALALACRAGPGIQSQSSRTESPVPGSTRTDRRYPSPRGDSR